MRNDQRCHCLMPRNSNWGVRLANALARSADRSPSRFRPMMPRNTPLETSLIRAFALDRHARFRHGKRTLHEWLEYEPWEGRLPARIGMNPKSLSTRTVEKPLTTHPPRKDGGV